MISYDMLADGKAQAPRTIGIFTEDALDLYARMFLIRSVEERIKAEYSSRNIRMAVHLSIGQEAVAAGVLMAAQPSDCCVSTHRCHAHYLAKGGDLGAMVDELYSLETGCSRGYGGSMHLFDKSAGMWGSGAIVGGGIPIAVGIGLALKQQGTENVSIGFSGDGGTDEGSFYESLNLAALLHLPVLFVVENNGYATETLQIKRQALPYVAFKAKAFGVHGVQVNGSDALAVRAAAQRGLQLVRMTSQPYLLEVHTNRMCAHVGLGDGWRTELEREEWLAHDPLMLLKTRIETAGTALPDRIVQIEQEELAKVDAAFVGSKARFETFNARAGLVAPEPPNPAMV